MHCCVCGSQDDVRRCGWCKHNFCVKHRYGWGVWDRGKVALVWWLFAHPPQFCDH